MPDRRVPGSRRAGDRRRAQPSARRQRLLVLSVVPMAVGLALAAAGALGLVLRGTAGQQAASGALLVLLGFALANLVQGHRLLAAGWALAAVATAVWLLVPAPARQPLAMGLAALAVVLLGWEFAQRLTRTLNQPQR